MRMAAVHLTHAHTPLCIHKQQTESNHTMPPYACMHFQFVLFNFRYCFLMLLENYGKILPHAPEFRSFDVESGLRPFSHKQYASRGHCTE